MKIGVLTNLQAGRSEAPTQRMLDELSRHGDVLRCETGDSEAVRDAVAELAEEGVELLVLNGGDGTVHRALTEMLTAHAGWRPMIAPTRCGRTNMIALDLGARRSPVRGLRDLLDAARSGRIEERVVVRHAIGADIGSEPRRYGMFLGAGMLPRAIALTYRAFPDGRAQGVFGGGMVTAALIARTIAGDKSGLLDPDKMQIALDGTPIQPEEFTLVMATTLDRLILGLRPFWGGGKGAIRLTTIAAGAHPFARSVPGILRGRPRAWVVPENGFNSARVEQAALRLDCGVAFDGELFDPEPGRLLSLHTSQPLRFVRA